MHPTVIIIHIYVLAPLVARASPAVALTLFPRHAPVSVPADLNFQFTDIFNGILVNPIKLISFDDKTALALI